MKTKTFKELSIKVTYIVDLSEVEIPEEVAEQMEQAYYANKSINLHYNPTYGELQEWLTDNVREDDCEYAEYEVEILETK